MRVLLWRALSILVRRAMRDVLHTDEKTVEKIRAALDWAVLLAFPSALASTFVRFLRGAPMPHHNTLCHWRAYSYAPARRRVFIELPPSDEHMCGLFLYSCHGSRDAAQNWEEELTSTLSDLKLTREIACPCVWQGCIKGQHILVTVHGDDITIV